MKTMSISDVRNRLPSVIDEVLATHEQIVVVRHGTPTVAITPYQESSPPPRRYPLRGHRLTIAKDFDKPMPELWNALTVAESRPPYKTGHEDAVASRKKRKKG